MKAEGMSILRGPDQEERMAAASPSESLDERVAHARESNRRAVEIAERRSSKPQHDVERSNVRIQRLLRKLRKLGYSA